MTRLIIYLAMLTLLPGCVPERDPRLSCANDLADKIAAGVIDTSWSEIHLAGKMVRLRSIQSGWRVRESSEWLSDNGASLTVCIHYVPDSIHVDTICYEEKECK